MKFKGATNLILSCLLLLSLMNICEGNQSSTSKEFLALENYERVYSFHVRFGHLQFAHKLYISVPPSLYDYYRSKRCCLSTIKRSDPLSFVTPEVIRPIAESIRSIINSDEEFANAILTLVHQIPYIKSDLKYPVETLVENSGDCDVLAVLAASIMKAGGLDVVLFHYEGINPPHMNIGVHLPNTPIYHTWGITPKFYEYDGRKYWIAECVPSGIDSKVGDQILKLEDISVRIIPLSEYDDKPPAYVSANLDAPLKPYGITLYPHVLSLRDYGYILNLSGLIFPPVFNKSVIVYVEQKGISQKDILRTCTDNFGHYSLSFNLTPASVYYIKASVSEWGNLGYSGSDSETLIIFVGPRSLVQFEGEGYNYTYGRVGLAGYWLRIGTGLKEFFDYHLFGRNFTFSCELMMLEGEQGLTTLETQALGETVILKGLQRLRLPDDFSLKINNRFHITFSYNSSGSHIHVKGLNYYDVVPLMEKVKEKETVFWDISANIRDKKWYKASVKMVEGKWIAELGDADGVILDSVAFRKDSDDPCELEVFTANIKDSVVVFKNLRIETLKETKGVAVDGDDHTPLNRFVQLSLFILLILFFTVIIIKVYAASRYSLS